MSDLTQYSIWFNTIGLIVACSTLIVLAHQTRRAAAVEQAKFVDSLEIDGLRFMSLFEFLLPYDQEITKELENKIDENLMLVFNALDFFEKLQLMLEKGVIDFADIDYLFAGRFFIIAHSPIIQTKILRNEDYFQYFRGYRKLYRNWYNYRDRNGEPIVGEENAISEFL